MIPYSFRIAIVVLALGAHRFVHAQSDDDANVVRVMEILQTKCIACHGSERNEGGLELVDRESVLRGGESGPAIRLGAPDRSELVRRIAAPAIEDRMPPQGEPLSIEEVEQIRHWIANQAPWSDGTLSNRIPDSSLSSHWAWQPLVKPSLPSWNDSEQRQGPSLTAIDDFILAKLREADLGFSPMADRRTLIRRLSFDLLGIPPRFEEVQSFERDLSEEAYEHLVDRMLASPRYGERWGRHWLDIVHYGDTHGYDKDKPRPNAWPYRDYVIRALNDDKPYERFVQEQIAGDVLFPGTRDGIEALGFISAGPWDFIGHAEVAESKIDGQIARNLDRDDMVTNTLGTFCSVTIGCARCHAHKFDPISQSDYYSLQAVFAALDRADRSYYADDAVRAKAEEIHARRTSLIAQRESIQTEIQKLGGPELQAIDRQIADIENRPRESQAPEFGYHSAIATDRNQTKWVQLDLGHRTAIDEIVLYPCYDDFNQIGAGFGFPLRFRVQVSDDPEGKETSGWQVECDADLESVRQLVPQSIRVPTSEGQPVVGRYVRITALVLAPRQNDFILALSEVVVRNDRRKIGAQGAQVTALDTIEAPPRWSRTNLIDGVYPKERSTFELAMLRDQRRAWISQRIPTDVQESWKRIEQQWVLTEQSIAQLPPPDNVFVGTVHHGSGTFVGTGANGGQPRRIRILARGNVTSPTREVAPGALRMIDGLQHHFALRPEHTEGERRGALAHWITDRANHLTWRSIVNRVWQFHFGRGLVETPDDFGKMGGGPSHAELLDWLACEFRDSGGSLKRLHKHIVMSRVYQQSSLVAGEGKAQEIDTDNRWLWRQNRRKLDAESVRDSILMVAGSLHHTMGGPGFQDFVIERPEHSPHYEYELSDPNEPKLWRRSIYRFIVRSQTQPFLTSFDCADPSMRVDRRNETNSAAQALSLLNNGLSISQSSHLARRVQASAGSDVSKQVQHAVGYVLLRDPASDERSWMIEYVNAHGLVNFARVLLNVNEFVFVD